MQRRNKTPTTATTKQSNVIGIPLTQRKESEDNGILRHYKAGAALVVFALCTLLVVFSHGSSSSTTTVTKTTTTTKTANGNVRGLATAAKEEGRLIRFTLSNLDGEEGRTGTFMVRTKPSWSPLGVERLEALVESSFWSDCRFFRVLPNFMAQFGINGDPSVQSQWRGNSLKDDPVVMSNKRGTVSFATSGKNTRTTQLFINYKDNHFLDSQGFSPVAEVLGDGMSVVDRIYNSYRERPNQGKIQRNGNEYLNKEFPKLSYIEKAEFVAVEDSAMEPLKSS